MNEKQIIHQAMNLFVASPTGMGLTGGPALAGFALRAVNHLVREWREDDISYGPFARVPGAPFGRSVIVWYRKLCQADIQVNSDLVRNLGDISTVLAHEAGHHASAGLSIFEQEIWCQILGVYYFWDFVAASRDPRRRWRYATHDGQIVWSPLLPPSPTQQMQRAAESAQAYLAGKMIDRVLAAPIYRKHLTVEDVRRHFDQGGGPGNRDFASAGAFIARLAATGRLDDAHRILVLLWHTMHNSHAHLAGPAGQAAKLHQMRSGWATLVREAGGLAAIRDALARLGSPHHRDLIRGIGRYWGSNLG